MDVTRITFQRHLSLVLESIAGANFVALDLELSGIPGRQPNAPRRANEGSGGKQSLQHRYEENKKAAERYQVLQMGITCIEEDIDRGIYIARPFNICLNPVPDERLEIERIISYQSGAVEFLLSHRFRMEAPYLEGVPYLSREEEALARRLWLSRQDKAAVMDIKLRDDDPESLEFVRRVRNEIDGWKNWNDEEVPKPGFLNIAPIGHELMGYTGRGLNNFQKRLVHQIVRAEYPDLVTVSRAEFIRIVAYNKKREDALQDAKLKGFEERLTKEVGLRWLVEAMVGGDLNALDPAVSRRNNGGRSDETHYRIPWRSDQQFLQAQASLKEKKTILVGHNVFMDLINLYACFFGNLPDRVEDFQRTIHQLFPMIIDTKFLATYENGARNVKSSLEELDEELQHVQVPVIEIHPDHPKYNDRQPLHEAGCDSFLTAKVLIRLSAKLEAAGRHINPTAIPPSDDEEAYETAPEDGGVLLDVSNSESGSTTSVSTSLKTPSGESSISEGVPLDGATYEAPSFAGASKKKKKKKKSKGAVKAAVNRKAFSHATVFDLLGHLSSAEEEENVSPVLAKTLPGRKPEKKTAPPPPPKFTMMPSFDGEFWKAYSNRLRVNGTAEGVCNVGSDD